MNSRVGHRSTLLQETPEVPGANEKPDGVTEIEVPLQPTQSTAAYRKVSLVRSGIWLCSIILANCVCSACICLCFWGYAKVANMDRSQKRAFNTLSLLLSATLSFGVGFLFDQVGLLARGTILQSRPYSQQAVGYIMRGTLSSYTSLLGHQVRIRHGLVTASTWVLFAVILCSLLGRFGVAFLGFTYNLEDTPYTDPPLLRPDWIAGTVGGDNSTEVALKAALGISSHGKSADKERTAFADTVVAGSLFQTAQIAKGLPWLLPRGGNSSQSYLEDPRATSYAMNISHFANGNLGMEVLGENTVTFTYKFQDFRGADAVAARGGEWETPASLTTRCQEFIPSQDMDLPPVTSNLTDSELASLSSYRWIARAFRDQLDENYLFYRNATNQIWLTGHSRSYDSFSPEFSSTTPLVMEHSYVANKTIIFNCSVYFDSRMIAADIYDPLRWSLALPALGSGGTNSIFEDYRDFESTVEFDFGVSRKDRAASALWLAAYIGNYIGNSLGYLNEVLRRVEIEAAERGNKTKLSVKWRRVGGMLGGLAAFQVLFGLAALLYCRHGFEIVDDVSTLSSMLTGFRYGSEEERRQEDAIHEGRFVGEEGGFRWEFAPGAGKDIKVT